MKNLFPILFSIIPDLIIFSFFIFTLIILPFLFIFVRLSSLATGERSGYITAIDQRGYFFRNYKLHLKTDNSSSQEDEYCIFRDDEELIKKAQEANKKRGQVLIRYKGVRGIGLGLCENAQITGIY